MRYMLLTDIGDAREINEDSILLSNSEGSIQVSNSPNLIKDGDIAAPVCALVFDGMGGHNAGEHASHQAVVSFKEILDLFFSKVSLSIEESFKILAEAFEKADNAIQEIGADNPPLQGLGSTIAGFLYGSALGLITFHAGDSRVYHFKNGISRCLTTDHNLYQSLIKSGQIAKEGEGAALTNCLGGGVQGNYLEIKQHTNFTPDPGSILYTCTDGIHGFVDPDTLDNLLEETPFQDLSQALSKAIRKNGAKDNFSGIFIGF